MRTWSPEIDEVLEASGWTPGRKVDTARWRSVFEAVGLAMHDAAEAFLQEFGGLTVNVSGPGISCARTPFELDPELAWGEDDRFTEWGEAIGRHLYPLGELDHGRFFLGIDEVGVIYLVETWVASFGPMPGSIDVTRQQLSTSSEGTHRTRISMSMRTGGTRRHSATARWRPPPAPVASAFVPGSGRAAHVVLPVGTELLSEAVDIRRGQRLPNCQRNAALRHRQSQMPHAMENLVLGVAPRRIDERYEPVGQPS